MRRLEDAVSRLAKITESVIVGVSGGKDSVALLDLCRKHFSKVEGFFLYLVEGLDFEERYLRYIERRYRIRLHRLPHWMLGDLFRRAVLRHDTEITLGCKKLTIADIEFEMRKRTGIEWVATGQKACDSIERNAMIRNCDAIDEKRNRAYPLMLWTDKAVYGYLKMQRIPLSPDYRLFGRSWGGNLRGSSLSLIAKHYPSDFRRISEVFPLAGAEVFRHEQYDI